ncbi:hypothetical protein ACJX0J_039964, partial [Zea mays]
RKGWLDAGLFHRAFALQSLFFVQRINATSLWTLSLPSALSPSFFLAYVEGHLLMEQH